MIKLISTTNFIVRIATGERWRIGSRDVQFTVWSKPSRFLSLWVLFWILFWILSGLLR